MKKKIRICILKDKGIIYKKYFFLKKKYVNQYFQIKFSMVRKIDKKNI